MNVLSKVGITVSASSRFIERAGKDRFAVTFDDGFRSVVSNALPIMIERGIPATIFVTTGSLGKRPEWIINRKHPNIDEELLSEEEIEKLPFDLVTVGSHCVTHRDLNSLNRLEILSELWASKNALEKIVKRSVILLSLPYGGHNETVLELAREVGYERIFLNVPLLNRSDEPGVLVGRINVSPEDWKWEFRLKALGAYQWLPIAFRAKKIFKCLCEATLGRAADAKN